MKMLALSITILLSLQVTATNYYVATNGSDNSNNGSINQPFATLQKFHSIAQPGDTCFVRGGTYYPTSQTNILSDGTAANPICIVNYPGEAPVFDGRETNNGNFSHAIIRFNVAYYWQVKGLSFTNTVTEYIDGIKVMSSHHIKIENCKAYKNRGCGFSAYANTTDPFGGGNDLLFKNCDAYLNDDYGGATPHEDGDGFQVQGGGFTNLVYDSCRAWNNADDGFDFFFATPNTVTLKNCWAFYNGADENGNALGNGNGFKLGGATAGYNTGGVTLTNCLAWKNLATGFDQNSAQVAHILYNCTAFSNSLNYEMNTYNLQHIIKNSISFGTTQFPNFFGSNAIMPNNTWTLPVTVNNADFVSVDDANAKATRTANGTLPALSFLKLAAGSDLIDAGTNVSLSYEGAAPDLGAYEFTNAVLPVTITAFTANTISNKEVLVKWHTQNEENLAGYEVQRATIDAFAHVSFVAANNKGHDNTYSFTDNKLPLNNNRTSLTLLYRLKSIDKDGKYQYSLTVGVKIIDNKIKDAFTVFPNPVVAGNAIKIQINIPLIKTYQLRITDIDGRIIIQQNNNNQSVITISTNQLKNGVYILNLCNNAGTTMQQQRFVIQR